ncbi:MAG: glycosyltransferase family protein [Pseudomonadota bacterium]
MVIIIQARMGSTRLPGKVLRSITGRPMLSYQIERLKRVSQAPLIVVATTVEPADDAIVDFCSSEGIVCTRGSEQDVLDRYWQAANKVGASAIVRITSDCPLIDPQLVDSAIAMFTGPGEYDYVSNMLTPTWPYGMAVEVFSAKALAEAWREATEAEEREHVTPFIYWRPSRYHLGSLTMRPDLSAHRWTVDTPEDFELISRILGSLYVRKPLFDMNDVLALLEDHPEWSAINAHVEQKVVTPQGEKH